MNQKRVLLVFGTRPEAIKMAPVVRALDLSEWFEPIVCVTGQHREMLDQVMRVFDIQSDFDLDLMKPGQDLFDVTSRGLLGVRDVIRDSCPDYVLVHGDTTTCFVGALAAFYEKVPVGHVEAGLRTGDISAPFPEEANRSIVARLGAWHFAPTASARDNLIRENVCSEKITITGNTGIDALLEARGRLNDYSHDYWFDEIGKDLYGRCVDENRKLILVTAHRRENIGEGLVDLCDAILHLAYSNSDWDIVFPVHLNPNVQGPVTEKLTGIENIHLIGALSYLAFIWMLDRCEVCLTDSGGVQEEAPSLGTQVLVLREVTERPEAVKHGSVRLVGTDKMRIISEVERCIDVPVKKKLVNPYGDGNAAERIVRCLEAQFGSSKPLLTYCN